MNKKLMASVLAASILLSGCGSNGRQIDAQFNPEIYLDYMTEDNKVDSLNYLVTNNEKNLSLLGNLVDGLVETDRYGNIKAAASQDIGTPNDDYTVWEFSIRGGMPWVDSAGQETGNYVKADDFIASLYYVLDAKHNSAYKDLVCSVVKNAQEYVDGKVSFDQVGIKAVNDYTIRYTLTKSCSYFNTYLLNGGFYPVSRALINQVGDEFATSPETLWYNGCYYLTSATESEIEFKRNTFYYDLGNVSFEKGTITQIGTQEAALEQFKKGKLSYAYITDTYANTKANTIDTHMYMSGTSYETYTLMFNFNSDDKQIAKAFTNDDFRKAIFYAFNQNDAFVTDIEEETKEEETNSEAQGNQAEVEKATNELNVDVQSTIIPSSFATQNNGTDYVTLGSLGQFSSKTNYDATKMEECQQKAIEALSQADPTKKDDVVVLFPLTLRIPVSSTDVILKNSLTNAFKALDSTFVQLEFVEYSAENPKDKIINENKYDMILTSIKAEYGDPSAYLCEFTKTGETNSANSHFDDKAYNDLYVLADAIPEFDLRLMAFAECEAYLLQKAYVIPYSHGNFTYKVSSINDFSLPTGTFGLAHYKLKNVRAFENALNLTERKELKAAYEEAKKEGI